ncbi:tetratricopeptide repeat protein [Calidifontibacillus erzurumensis]|uniref:Tetratricopeptide repeat protein n=1 Tax=Calidifontibacillus erzurumensis TaxID=2741433 RepID=A0A8J8GGW5_9BACI|nr:tetratricopeptide repeat protein [Calidifontibacillus erzurumensis]NSL53174.1 tetratricopeptide repeat protein [Calidifontibacillus erzurumensis]
MEIKTLDPNSTKQDERIQSPYNDSKKNQYGEIVEFVRDGEHFFNKGLKYYRQRDLNKAKKYLHRAIHFNPKKAEYLCQLAIVLSELEEYKKANALLLDVVEKLDPNMYECYSFLANNYAHLGLFQEAKKYANMYLTLAPDGEFYEDTEELLDLLSIEMNELDIHSEEDELIIRQETARELLEQGKLEEASDMLQKIVKEYPEFWSAYNNLSLAQFYLGNVQKAVKITQDVLKRSKGNLHALCNLAVFYYYLGREKDVADLVEQLKAVHPIDMDHRSKLGVTFALLGQYESAYTWLRWLYKHGYEGDGAFYYWLSISAFYTNHENFAKEIWQKVVKLNPDKQGTEPWSKNYNYIGQHELKMYEAIIYTFKSDMCIEKKLLLLLLLMKTGNMTALEEINEYLQNEDENPILKEFAKLMLCKLTNEKAPVSERVIDAGHVIDTISEFSTWPEVLEQKFYLFWFRVMVGAFDEPISFKNHHAWAAVIEFGCLLAEGHKVTKKQLADKYGISTSTFDKYIDYASEQLI